MLRSRNRALSLGRQSQGRLDVPLMLITAALTVIGLIAVANATIDPYAVSEGTGIFSVLSRLTSNSFYWQLAWVGVGLVAIVLIQIFDYRVYGELAVYIFGVALALLGFIFNRPISSALGAEGVLLDVCEISTGNACGIFPGSVMILRANLKDYANDAPLADAVTTAYAQYELD